jgi:uncharacterized protein
MHISLRGCTLIFALTGGFFFSSTAGAAEPEPKPSFDCAKAMGTDERLICGSPDLARRDAQLARAYRQLREDLPEQEKAALGTGQREWVSRRNRGCGLARDTAVTDTNRAGLERCLSNAYGEREVSSSSIVLALRSSRRIRKPTKRMPCRPRRICARYES